MILEKGIHPGELKDMVTSPGGTTIEGCEALEKGGMRAAVIECINAGTEKSKNCKGRASGKYLIFFRYLSTYLST